MNRRLFLRSMAVAGGSLVLRRPALAQGRADLAAIAVYAAGVHGRTVCDDSHGRHAVPRDAGT